MGMSMNSPTAQVLASLLAYLFLALASTAWAGGEGGPDDHVHDDGPNFFGFVKDTAGKTIRDAKVTADIKSRPSVVARTNAAGAYRIPGFGKDISANNVTISCAKEGYKQTKTLLKTRPSKTPPTAIEIECTMQQIKTK